MSDSDDIAEEKEFLVCVGPLAIDVPRTLGYFAGVGGAVAFGLIAPELAIFVAAVPLLKLLKRENAPKIERMIGAIFEGAAKPVGGDSEGCIRTRDEETKKIASMNRKNSLLTKDTTPVATPNAEPYFSTANGAS
jgi:hypothetical protein